MFIMGDHMYLHTYVHAYRFHPTLQDYIVALNNQISACTEIISSITSIQ